MKEVEEQVKPSLWIVLNANADTHQAYITHTRRDFHQHELVGVAPPVIGNEAGKALRTLDHNQSRLTYLYETGFVTLSTELYRSQTSVVELVGSKYVDEVFVQLGEIVSIAADQSSEWIYSISIFEDAGFAIARTSLTEKRTEILYTLANSEIKPLANATWMAEREALLFCCIRAGEYTFVAYQPATKTLQFIPVKNVHLSHWTYHQATHSVYGLGVAKDTTNPESYELLHVDLDNNAVVKQLGKLGMKGVKIMDATLDQVFMRYIMLVKHQDEQYEIHAVSLESMQEIAEVVVPKLYHGPVYGLEVVHTIKK